MNILHTIILGVVEGITEFLPISSTAHLEIVQLLLKIPTTDFVKSFEIAIQLGAILAVVVIYWKKIFSSKIYLKNILIAFVPTGVVGFVLYKIIKSFLLGNITIAATMLLLGGVIIIFYEHRVKSGQNNKIDDSSTKTIETLSNKELLIIGVAQALAVVPGVSRSGAVIISGRILGLPKILITEFSFLLAIPTMLAATTYDLLKSGFSFSSGEWGIMSLGFIISFITAFFVVVWLLDYIKKHSFSIFGWYRVILSLILFFTFIV